MKKKRNIKGKRMEEMERNYYEGRDEEEEYENENERKITGKPEN